MKTVKGKLMKLAVISACVVGFTTSSIATTVSADQGKNSANVQAAKTTTTTSFSRKSKVTKTKIVETSVKTVVETSVTVEKNSAPSKATADKGTRVVSNLSNLNISEKTTVKTVKTLSDTTVTTTKITTKVETFLKAKKGKLKFTFAMGSPGLSGTLIQESIERINFKYGYQGKFLEVANSDLVVAGGASGEFELGSSTTSAVMKVIQNGAPMRFIGENSRNQWTLVAKTNIKSCADMNGQRLGLHSPGGVSTALYRAWYVKNCAATSKPSELFIAGSPNRLQALVSGRLDVTMMEVEDTLALPATGYYILSNFSKDLPQIKTGLIWANQDFLAKNPKVADDLMYEMSRLSQEFNYDAPAFIANAKKWTPGYANIEKIVAAYQAAKLFPEDPGSFFKDLNETAAFYASGGTLKSGLLAEQMAILTAIKQAYKRLDF